MAAHSQNVENQEGIMERRIAVQGKHWNKQGVESEFSMVLFTDTKRDLLENKMKYNLVFNSDGVTTAKTPIRFLGNEEETIENDAQKVLERIRTEMSNG